jgi:hypothetical protein
MFLKPNVSRISAAEYEFSFNYQPRPTWETYRQLLEFASTIRRDQTDLRLRDMIDLQSFLWVQGSDEYRGRTLGRLTPPERKGQFMDGKIDGKAVHKTCFVMSRAGKASRRVYPYSR